MAGKGKPSGKSVFRKCPKCGESAGVPIFWGYPDPDCMRDLLEAADEGLVVLGGCCVSDDDPMWHCKKCGHEWGR